ncbi:MAG: cytidine deaminase [Sediminicola sp.]
MKRRTLTFEMLVFASLQELTEVDKELMLAAIVARENAYAPYSKFNVGAAVLLENGETITGNNQENASYPSGLCAERVAVFYAGAKYPGVPIKAIAVTATSQKYQVDLPACPCGNCRQALSEYEQKQNKPIRLLLMGEIGEVILCSSVADLLPLAFNGSFLG